MNSYMNSYTNKHNMGSIETKHNMGSIEHNMGSIDDSMIESSGFKLECNDQPEDDAPRCANWHHPSHNIQIRLR